MKDQAAALALQKRILKGLGFGFVEHPMEPTVAEAPAAGPRSRKAEPPARRESPPSAPSITSIPSLPVLDGDQFASAMATLRQGIGSCRKCDLSIGRQNAIPGGGARGAQVFFICECPEEEDDREGKALRGELGGMLDRIVGAMGLSEADVYRTLATRCRGIAGRLSRPAEVQACAGWMHDEIELVRPRTIVCLGERAIDSILPEEGRRGMPAIRGRFLDYRGVPVLATYGLEYMRRNPGKKRDAWGDLQKVMARLKEEG